MHTRVDPTKWVARAAAPGYPGAMERIISALARFFGLAVRAHELDAEDATMAEQRRKSARRAGELAAEAERQARDRRERACEAAGHRCAACLGTGCRFGRECDVCHGTGVA